MRKIFSLLMAFTLIISTGMSSFAMTVEHNNKISNNSILIGERLFLLDKDETAFNLDTFMSATRSIKQGEENTLYYKDNNGNWYNLVSDKNMTSVITHENINNQINYINNVQRTLEDIMNVKPHNSIEKEDLSFAPTGFEENKDNQGTFDTVIKLTLSDKTTAKFANNIDGTVDTISSASLLKTAPKGTKLQITRVDDKNINLKLIGTAQNHSTAINTTNDTANQHSDGNKNGIHGDIAFLMLPPFFTDVDTHGTEIFIDTIYNDKEQEKIIDVQNSKRFQIENVNYGVITLKTGNINDYNFTINDVAFTPSKVNDSGTMVKFEMNRSEVAQIKVISKTDSTLTDTINIGEGTESFTAPVGHQAPDRVLASGPVSLFDYYLVDYDENGNYRKELKKSTFDTENESSTTNDPSVPTLTLEKQRTPMGEDIEINVTDNDSIKVKKYLENIYEVLKDYEGSANSRVKLQYSIDVDNSKIIIKGNSAAIDGRNGHHKIVIKSNSFNDVHFEFETVEPAGSINLSPNFEWYANDELLFELDNFNYAVINPIYEVTLDGEKLVKFENVGDTYDYYVLSNLVRLCGENVLNKLTVGQHTLVIKAHGFEDFTRTFTLDARPQHADPNPKWGNTTQGSSQHGALKVDAVSAATGLAGGGGSSSGGSSSNGGSGGGLSIRANVIFSFDQVVNALILQDLQKSTNFSNKVIDQWRLLTKDAIITDGSDVLVEYKYFKNHVGINGEFKTFKELFATMPATNPSPAEYMNMGYNKPAGLYLNRPYQVKNILHDGLMGLEYQFNQVTKKQAPTLSLQNTNLVYGDDVVISYTDITDADKWAETLKNVQINYNYLKFTVDKDNNTITFENSKNAFATGTNHFVFNSEEFKIATIDIDINKKQPTNISITKDSNNNIVVATFEQEFIKNLKGVYLGGKGLFNDEQVSVTTAKEGDYEVVGNQLVIRGTIFGTGKDKFKMDKLYTLTIKSTGYADFHMNFNPNDLIGGTIQAKQVPDFVKLNDENTYGVNEPVFVDVSKTLNSEYRNAITEVQLNGTKLIEGRISDNPQANYTKHDVKYLDSLGIYAKEFTNAGHYTIKIIADNFEDKTIEFDITATVTIKEVPTSVRLSKSTNIKVGESLELILGDEVTFSDYEKKVNKVIVNSNENAISTAIHRFNLTDKVTEGDNTITVKAEGYKDKTFNVNITKADGVAKLVNSANKLIDETTLSLDMPKDIIIFIGRNDLYKNAITNVSLDNNSLTENTDYEYKNQAVDSLGAGVLIVKAENFDYGNQYNINVEATGYTTKTFTIDVKTNQPKAVPSFVKLSDGNTDLADTVSINMGDTVKIKLDKPGYISKDSEYTKAITNIKINQESPTQPNGDEFELTSLLSSGLNTVTIFAAGYENKVFNITVNNVESPAKLIDENDETIGETSVNVEVNNGLDIFVGSSYNQYKSNITDIELDSNKLSSDKYSYSTKGIDSVSSNVLTIKPENFGVVGQSTLTIKADGYDDKTFTINVVAASLKPAEATFSKDGKTVKIGTSLDLRLSTSYYPISDYAKAVNNIVINGVDNLVSNNNSVNYSISDKVQVGVNNITVKATGYEDKSFTVTVEKDDSPAKLIIDDNTSNNTSITLNKIENVKVALESYSDKYKDSITDIKLDNSSLSSDKYSIVEESINYSSYNVLDVDKSNFAAGKTYTLTIESSIYADKSFTIVVDANAQSGSGGSTTNLEVPDYVGFKNGSSYSNTKDLTSIEEVLLNVDIALSGGDIYKNNIESITVANGSSSTDYQKNQLSISPSPFKTGLVIKKSYLKAGENTITVHANGYKDYTCTVNVTISLKQVPSYVKLHSANTYKLNKPLFIQVAEKGWSADITYRNAITEIYMDDNLLTKSVYNDKDYRVPDRGYKEAVGFFAHLFNTAGEHTIKIVANGYEEKEITFTITDPNASSGSGSGSGNTTTTGSGTTVDPNLKDVPSEVGHRVDWGQTKKDQVTVTDEYKNAINEIKFHNSIIEISDVYEKDSWSGDKFLNFKKLSSTNGGTYDDGNYDVVIKATGYKDFSISIKLGW